VQKSGEKEMAKLKRLANKKQLIKIIGIWLLADGLLSIFFLNLQPRSGLNIAFWVRFIRIGIGLYLLWS